MSPEVITSPANPLIKTLRKLATDSTAYRKAGQIWLEGDHLCSAAMARGIVPDQIIVAHSYFIEYKHNVSAKWSYDARKIVVIADTLMASLSSLESPARMGFVLPLPAVGAMDAAQPTNSNAQQQKGIKSGLNTVVLDRLQDAGNVGSIIRSAAAFGFAQIVALKGTAALWSPKVLRAGMGAHFALHLVEGADAADLSHLNLPLLATSSHQGSYLHATALPSPAAWIMGHEGQGVSPELAAIASLHLRITQPGGEESLNVAAAAAICLHASAACSA
jgi:TrmH family RNA methyltransferase